MIDEYFKDKGHYFCITGSFDNDKKQQIYKFYRDLQSRFPQVGSAAAPPSEKIRGEN